MKIQESLQVQNEGAEVFQENKNQHNDGLLPVNNVHFFMLFKHVGLCENRLSSEGCSANEKLHAASDMKQTKIIMDF